MRESWLMLRQIDALCRQAGAVINEVYATDFEVRDKGGNDPVTEADARANDLLCEGIDRMFPGVVIVAEESEASAYEGFGRLSAAFFVDPLDGTREFVARNGEFVVMVGLAIDGEPRLGVVHAPAQRISYVGAVGQGAFVVSPEGVYTKIEVAPRRSIADTRVVVSRTRRGERLDRLVAAMGLTDVRPLGSAGLKGAAVAQGDADLYAQLGRAGSLWDLCAPDAIVRASGGVCTDERGEPIDYRGKLVQERGVVAAAPALHQAVCDALARLP